MFPTPPRTLNPLVTDIESLASSYFWKIVALFAKLQRLAHEASRQCIILRPVCTENLFRVSEVMESPKLAE
jgi:hypothetical protein